MLEAKAIILSVLIQLQITLPVDDVLCLANTLHFESGWYHTSFEDRVAVGYVVINRVKSPDFPNDICAVVHQPAQFSYLTEAASTDPLASGLRLDTVAPFYNTAQLAIAIITSAVSDPTDGATYYHAHYVAPAWAKEMVQSFRTESHVFYRGVE